MRVSTVLYLLLMIEKLGFYQRLGTNKRISMAITILSGLVVFARRRLVVYWWVFLETTVVKNPACRKVITLAKLVSKGN